MIDVLLIANQNSLPLYSMIKQSSIDETLLLAFFSALKSFVQSFMKENSELKWIHLGNALLDFDNVEIENLGKLDVLMISRELDPTTSHSILNEITEQFAIFLEQMCTDDPQIKVCMDRGMMPKFPGFDKVIDQIVSKHKDVNMLDVDLHVNIPKSILNKISDMFKISPDFREAYENNERLVLEQIFSQYAQKGLEDDVKKNFRVDLKK